MIFSQFPEREHFLATLRIGQDVSVHGQVYADGLLELQGNVFGRVLCRRFILQTPSGFYENLVLNGTMDISRLSPHYAGSTLLNSGKPNQLLKWLK